MDQSLASKFQALFAGNRQQQPSAAAPTNYASFRVYTEDELQAMGMVELRNVLRSLGLSLGPLPKWQLISHALAKQQELQQQQLLFRESELKELPFFELEQIASSLGIEDTSLCLHSEIIELILATQQSLNDATATATATTSTTATTSSGPSLTPSAPIPLPPEPTSSSHRRNTPSEPPPKRSEGLKDCGLCFEPMGGNATRQMAVPPCGHLFCYVCWMRVVKEQGKCPLCSAKVSARDIRKIYV